MSSIDLHTHYSYQVIPDCFILSYAFFWFMFEITTFAYFEAVIIAILLNYINKLLEFIHHRVMSQYDLIVGPFWRKM